MMCCAFVSEWRDSPLCALTLVHDEFDPISTTDKWQSATGMALDCVPIDEAACDFESGKRLNQTVMSTVRHFFHTPRDCCFTLFSEPATTICVSKLRAFPAFFRELFSDVTAVFERTESADEFRVRKHLRGIFIFARDAQVVRRACSLVERVVSLTLKSPLSWAFRCERKRWLPVTMAKEAVVAYSHEALQEAMSDQGGVVRCVMIDARLALDDSLLSTLCAIGGGGGGGGGGEPMWSCCHWLA
jgi:hypothetical protein